MQKNASCYELARISWNGQLCHLKEWVSIPLLCPLLHLKKCLFFKWLWLLSGLWHVGWEPVCYGIADEVEKGVARLSRFQALRPAFPLVMLALRSEQKSDPLGASHVSLPRGRSPLVEAHVANNVWSACEILRYGRKMEVMSRRVVYSCESTRQSGCDIRKGLFTVVSVHDKVVCACCPCGRRLRRQKLQGRREARN